MEVVGVDPLRYQEFGDFFGFATCRAVDDGSAGRVCGKVLFELGDDLVKLVEFGCLHHCEVEVRAATASVEVEKVGIEVLLEVFTELCFDFGFGGCGQAQHRWCPAVSGFLTDEASDVAVVGAEVVPPF